MVDLTVMIFIEKLEETMPNCSAQFAIHTDFYGGYCL